MVLRIESKFSKFAVLQLIAIFSLPLGAYIAPGNPIYPFLASETEMSLISYIEAHIQIVMGGLVSTVSFVGGRLLKLPLVLAILATLLAGALLSAFDAFRVGMSIFEWPQYWKFSSISGYFLGIFAAVGFFASIEKLILTNEEKPSAAA